MITLVLVEGYVWLSDSRATDVSTKDRFGRMSAFLTLHCTKSFCTTLTAQLT